MTSPILYRPAHRFDIPHMARIWSVEKGEGGTSEERMTAYFDGRLHPQQALLPRVVYVATEGAALIGYVAGHLTRRYACDGELEWIYVAPEQRRTALRQIFCVVWWPGLRSSMPRECVSI